MKKILGTSKLSVSNKLTLIENAQKKLDAQIGDLIVFYEEEDKIFIEKGQVFRSFMFQLIPSEDVASISVWKEITKAYRYELKPRKNQEVKSLRTLETCRKLNNISLGHRKDTYKKKGWSITYKDQQDQLPELRNKNDEFGKDLRNVYEDVEQNVLHRVDLGYQNFYRRTNDNKKNPKQYKKPGFPRFKGRNRYTSFTFPRYGYGYDIVDKYGNKNLKGDFIRLSKIGNVKFIKDREIGEPGIPFWIKTLTVKRDVDKWYGSFSVKTFVEIEVPIISVNSQLIYKDIDELNQKCKGIDMGIPNLITDSTSNQMEAPKFLKKSLKKLRREQRKLSRKQRYDDIDPKTGKVKRDHKTGKKIRKNSKNREKQRIKVAQVHKKIRNQRKNFNHNVSRILVNNNDLIIFEDLSIQKMMQDRKYSRGIADSGWYQIQMFTKYKAEWAGKMVDTVDPRYTSQNCSNCHKLVGRIEKGDIFECPSCGLKINVHVNAAINIRDNSKIYQDLKRKLSERLEIEKLNLSNRDAIAQISTNREAIAAIHAFGDVTSTQIEISEQVISMNKEIASNKKGSELSEQGNPRPLGRGS